VRKLRKAVDAGLPILGTLIVFLAVILILDQHLTLRIIVVLIGLLMIDAGIWKLTHPLLPNERQYKGLRAEVDDFIKIVRRLNSAALQAKASPAGKESVAHVVNEMHAAVNRMEQLAGRTDDELSRQGGVK
jgi:hypothetical protein